MFASEVPFNQMMRVAAGNPDLGVPASYMQVEYGLDELVACWNGFVHTSDAHGLEFKSRKHVCLEFSDALNEYLEYLGEPVSLKVGP
jgi:hypothetical protein